MSHFAAPPLACIVICAHAFAPPDAAPSGYLGIDVVQRNEGLMVWRVLPGPIDGNLVWSNTLARGDLLVTLDGEPATQASWDTVLARPIGSLVRIGYREGTTRGATGSPNPSGALREVEVRSDDPSVWRGSHQSGALPARTAFPAPRASLHEELELGLSRLGPNARARSEAVIESLDRIADRHGDPATPPLLRALFQAPADSESVIRRAMPTPSEFEASPFRAAAELVAGLAGLDRAKLPGPHGVFKIEHAQAGIWYLDFLLNGARARFDEWVKPRDARHPGLRSLVVERIENLLVRGPNARSGMEALRSLPMLGPDRAATILAHFDVRPEFAPAVTTLAGEDLPEALRGAVEGDVLAVREIPELGWVVFGGSGPNRYDLGQVAAVLDLGGDDRYEWRHKQAEHRLVVDLAGDDVHTSGELGPAGSVGAIAIIDDHGGNDRYEGGPLSAGTSLGVSAIIDHAGDDRYSGGAWSLGAAAGGAAVVVDLAGSDRIEGEGMGIGVGGPSGIGAFVDVRGDDVANLGARPSVYGVAGERAGFGMGFGFGFRLAAAGGVGAYLDLSGRDVRRSGEFSQGCGYFLGVGILLDSAGDDVAICDRYGLGGSAHQAAGFYLDLDGDDSYVARTAAHLGGAWDEALAIFIDVAGNDSYRMDGLAAGAAAQQAVGIAVDRAGDDLYRANGGCLGAAGSNEYHFANGGLGSFALFLDLAGQDRYPAGRSDGETVAHGEAPAARASGSDGVFHDARGAVPSGR